MQGKVSTAWLKDSDVRVTRHLGIGVLVAAATFCFATSAQARVLLGSPGTAALSNGLVAYWPLDGAVTNWTAGTSADISGNGNTITTNVTGFSPVVGWIGQAIFLGPGSFDIASTTSINQRNTMTIAFWVKGRPSSTSYAGLFYDKHTISQGWQILQAALGSDIYLELFTSGGSNQCELTAPTTLDNKWHHIVYIVNQGVCSGYKDGVFLGNVSYTHGNGFSGYDDLMVNSNPGANFPAALDDVRLYSRALSAGEVQQLYNLGAANVGHANTVTLSNGLVGYWPFDGATTNWKTNTTE